MLGGPGVTTRSAVSNPTPSVRLSPGVTASGRTRNRSHGANSGSCPVTLIPMADVNPSAWPISWIATPSKSVLSESIPSVGSKSYGNASLNPIAGTSLNRAFELVTAGA